MKKLVIKLYNPLDIVETVLLCEHMDSSKVMTCIYHAIKLNTNDKKPETNELKNYHFPKNVVRWNLMDGLITIFFDDNYYMEIARLND